jgi:hypothetical protein
MRRLVTNGTLGLLLVFAGCGSSVKEQGPVSELPQMTPERQNEMQEYMKGAQQQYQSKGITPAKDYSSGESK